MKQYTRSCADHGCTLMDDGESCPVGHFVTSWLIVEDGIVVAEADEERVRWLRKGKLDDVMVPDPDLTGRRPFHIDAGPMRNCQLRKESRRRRTERERCLRLGLPVPDWATSRRGPQFEESDASFMRSRKYRAQQMRSEEAEA